MIKNTIKNYRYYNTTSGSIIKNKQEPYIIKGLDIKNREELFKLNNEIVIEKINKLKSETKELLKSRGEELMNDLSKQLNLPIENLESSICKSPFTLRSYIIAANQGITFYHHELRKQITPKDDYERQKRKEFVEKLSREDQLDLDGKNNKKSYKKKSLDEKKSMSMEREMEIVREQQQEQTHFDQQLSNSTKWNLGQLEIQPQIDSFLQDELFASFNPYESIQSNSQSFQLSSRLSKFYWKKDITKWEMFSSSKLNQLIPQLQYHILDKIDIKSDGDNIIIEQLLESIKFISDEINLIDLKIFEQLNYSAKNQSKLEIEKSISQGGNFKNIINNSIVDSLIYMKGHHFRITSEPFVTFFQILKENQDYFSSLSNYKEFLENLLNSLLFDTIIFDPSNNRQLEYKIKLDLLQREALRQFKIFFNYQTCPDPERHEESELRKLSHLCKTFQKRPTIDFIQESKKYLSNQILSNGILNSNNKISGLSNDILPIISTDQIVEGLYTCIPSTMSLLDFSISNSNKDNQIFDTENGKLEGVSSVNDLVYKFANSKHIFTRLPLSQRFLNFIQSKDDIKGMENPIYKLMIDLEDRVLELSQEDYEECPIDNWVGGMSIELEEGEDLEYDETSEFNIVPSQNYQLVKINNHLLSQLHKTFSEDLDMQVEELELTIKNKKILERELKSHNDKLTTLINDAKQSNKPTLYFIGIQDNQVYTLEIADQWEQIWNQLKKYPNGIQLNQFIDTQNQVDKDSFLTTLSDLNKFGVVGLFPKF